MKSFSIRLKELRNERGISLMSLGKIIGVTDSAISNWENGINDITSEHLIKLAKFFEVTTDYLLGLEN